MRKGRGRTPAFWFCLEDRGTVSLSPLLSTRTWLHTCSKRTTKRMPKPRLDVVSCSMLQTVWYVALSLSA